MGFSSGVRRSSVFAVAIGALLGLLGGCGGAPEPAVGTVAIEAVPGSVPLASASPVASGAPGGEVPEESNELARLDAEMAAALGPPVELPATTGKGAIATSPLLAPSATVITKGPVAAISLGGVSVSGGSISNASAVVAGMAAGFRRCTNLALRQDPAAVSGRGTITMTATVGQNGEVTWANGIGAIGISAAIVPCLIARVAAAQFAPPVPSTATITIPVTIIAQ